jgi:hypothetical protein
MSIIEWEIMGCLIRIEVLPWIFIFIFLQVFSVMQIKMFLLQVRE